MTIRQTNRKKPRVLVVGPTLKQMGGVGMFNEILLGSPLLRDKFDLLHLDTTRPAESADKVATLAPVNFLFFFRQWLRLVQICLFQRPKIMHQPITDRVSFFKEAIFMLTARLLGVRVVGHLHGNQFTNLSENKRGWVRRVVGGVMRLPNVVITLSDGWRRYLHEQVSPRLRVEVVPNTVDADFAGLARQIDISAPKSGDRCKVLFVGSLGTRKGVLDILKAAPLVRQQAPQVEFTLVGGLEVGAERQIIEQAQAEALAAGGVDFPGIVTGQPKLALFREADVFVLPSYKENFPISVLEAMAAGLPLVVTAVGALPEVLEEGTHCFFVQPGDAQALAERIVRLAQQPETRRKMGAANHALYQQSFAPEVILVKIEQLYNTLL
jgi:glycosyltransferase involved in cell wall biosynthesis